jgi:hypothetical protein
MTNQKANDSEGVHVGDCYVWSEISYLDSSTDYPECLPKRVLPKRQASLEEFITLDREAKLLGVLLAIGRSISRCLKRRE